MFKKLTTTILLTATLVMVGCEWDYPLSPPEKGIQDKSLVGFWRLKTKEDNAVYMFSQGKGIDQRDPRFKEFKPANLNHLLVLMTVELSSPYAPGEEAESWWAWTTVIDGVKYLNLQYREEPSGKKTDKTVLIIKYRVEGDKLLWSALSPKAKERINKELGEKYTSQALRGAILASGEQDWVQETLTRVR